MKTKKDIVFDVIFLVCLTVCVAVVIVTYSTDWNVTGEATTEPTTMATTEETTEATQESTEAETTATEPSVTLYDVPLDAELQLHIIHEAEKVGIDPAIIMAMAYRESSYNPNAVGDNGESFGLLQIQPKWHHERMKKLGCTDLFDPYQNVTVAIDYLCEMLNRYGSIEKALVGYNQGSYSGTITRYARTIMALAEELQVI